MKNRIAAKYHIVGALFAVLVVAGISTVFRVNADEEKSDNDVAIGNVLIDAYDADSVFSRMKVGVAKAMDGDSKIVLGYPFKIVCDAKLFNNKLLNYNSEIYTVEKTANASGNFEYKFVDLSPKQSGKVVCSTKAEGQSDNLYFATFSNETKNELLSEGVSPKFVGVVK